MIPSQPFNDQTLSALLFVMQQKASFTVCGSRYFGDATAESDFDFVVEIGRSGSLIERLCEDGWAQSPMHYADLNTITVFSKGSVQVIFAKSVRLRKAAREHIVKLGLDRHNTDVWDAFYKAEKLEGEA